MNAGKTQLHELVVFEESGAASVRDPRTGQAMHSWIGPEEEAKRVYLEPSRLRQRLDQPNTAPLVVYDVGLGIAANAIAALECQAALGKGARPLHLVSFEDDLSGLMLGLEHLETFPFLRRWKEPLGTLLRERRWMSADQRTIWELREGDFLNRSPNAPKVNLIFYDFYSPLVAPALWSMSAFAQVREACHPSDSTLLTYSASTRVRVALLLAGFFVGRGEATSAKMETTLASLKREELKSPLGGEWIARLRRSSAIIPFGMSDTSHGEILERVLSHPQFKI